MIGLPPGLKRWALLGLGSLIALYVLGNILRTYAGLITGLAALAILGWTFLETRGQHSTVGSGIGPTAKVGFRRQGRAIDPQQVATILAGGSPLGLPERLPERIAQSLQAYRLNRAPERPWSMMIVAEEDWTLREFARRFCQSLSLALDQAVSLEMTTTTALDPATVAKQLAARPVPVLILNATQRLHQHRSADQVTSPLEVVLTGQQPELRQVVILILERLDADAFRRLQVADVEFLPRMQQQRSLLQPLSQVPVGDVEIIAPLRPLSQQERVGLIWEEFCRNAEAEYGVTVANATTIEEAPKESELRRFLALAVGQWEIHGLRGAREFVRLSAEKALIDAHAAGLKRVSPYWDLANARLLFRPAV